jgi:HEAT repeat protein
MIQAALFILRQLGPSVSAETPRIASFLRHADVHVRREAATALTRTATIYHAGEIVVIADALGDEDALVRFRVAQAPGNFGAAAAPALPHLIAALDDPGDKVRAAAARSLGEIGNDTKRVVDALTAKLDDDDGRVRNYAAEALEHLRTETP